MRVFFLALSLFVLTDNLSGQKQNNIWYFGFNAGFDFNFQPPKPLYSDMVAIEGCASIADANGSLLFYTNGSQAWDKGHQVMPNGTGLLGAQSSTQAVLIVPLPNSNSIYYIITTGSTGPDGRMVYSIIDMNLNGGLGDILPDFKNIILETEATEQLTSILHTNTKDIWILSHRRNSNEFVAYLLTANGIDANPVVSSIGSVYGNGGIGPIKSSHNGTKIVASLSGQIIELFNFNSGTGEISDMIDLHPILNPQDSYYGVEFSPNDSLLYLSSSQPDLLIQLHLWTHEITILKTAMFDGFGALQLAPDGKIYLSVFGSEFVDIINQPNKPGFDCDFTENVIELIPGSMFAEGLPNLSPYSLFSDTLASPNLGDDIFVCDDSIVTLQIDFPVNCFPISYLWSDGSTGPAIFAEASGVYWVEVNSTCGSYKDTIKVDISSCETLVHYSLEACQSYMSNGTHMDYTEFTPTYPSILSCGDVGANHLNRYNPLENKHSCTPGVNGSVAMCINSYPGCFYNPGQESALFFDVTIIPETDSMIRLTGLEFYQRAPLAYDWINGDSGPNNYPRRVALRIMKNDVEIYRNTDIQSPQEWQLESISLLADERYFVTDSTVFRFEFLPYCVVNNGATVSAWDIDELKVFGTCRAQENAPIISGRIVSVNGKAMANVEVHVSQDSTFSTFLVTRTDESGNYEIEVEQSTNPYYIKPVYDYDILNGLNALDLIAIQKHLLGIQPFGSLLQFVASDLDKNGRITVSDLVVLNKLLLGRLQSIPNNTSWRFGVFHEDYNGTDLTKFKEVHKLILEEGKNTYVDFIGVKVGDANGNAQLD